ncbi:MAG TPA: hypothetical protein VJU53_12395 [Burkholderiaceae bacterium]|nr:hypothetical protein [Burkholderiaceae bacterium]
MKLRANLPSESALFRLVLARVVAGLIVVAAVVLAPPVADSIATPDWSATELADGVDDAGKPLVEERVDVQQTNAAPIEP